ncbi:valine--tRNA ligase [Methanorbis rubei]|uniref:Valine--tRNA ligase n=1 Tax=Methanorbis rubei TaxID=3028300 RepID=A0AAE4MDQ3_9EURY|nr:Valine--tRNA ligase [Methanocorpusculaceae archaeon Cs1]
MSLPEELPKTYDFAAVEKRWLGEWNDSDFYFDTQSKKPQYVIDTPPPYPTGKLHIGHALNWVYMDIIARYKRMTGYNVMFPQGWDCHGLPTEVKVEETHNITKNDVSREEFRRMCRELTVENIAAMRQSLRTMGFSVDWSNEYITMEPYYYGKTQLSFLRMLKDGYIYQDEHPVNYCTRCETAIAFAEVSYYEGTTLLNFFDFDGLEIATTRPELLAACVAVAVHPDDERYTNSVGKTLRVPIFGHDVTIIADDAVDMNFGSGAVMICTFGDKTDVFWWKKHHLPLRKALSTNGTMTAICGKYQGMTSKACREAILADMKALGILKSQKQIDQRVGGCWRCKTPIEILSERQWFVRVKGDEIVKTAREIKWYPEHMLQRLENWAEQMEWDWCISRQRLFATPIPVWFCDHCGETILPDEADLPIDPTVDKPKHACPKCGGTSFTGETDVLDTWMDSSITDLHITGWDGSGKPPFFPSQIRPQGHDIIRTWAFYTILRSIALTGEKPWDGILINGMVLGEDGFKMSKSRGNVIGPEDVMGPYGVDALRQWAAAGSSTGQDIQFNWNDVVAASRFQTKMWNIVRFSLMQINKETAVPETNGPATLIDRWMLANLSHTIAEVTDAMENYLFDKGLKLIRDFAWNVLADEYLEFVKGRLYSEDPDRAGAVYTLRTTVDALCTMLSPYIPFFAQECYHHLSGGARIVDHPWSDFSYVDADAMRDGDLVVKIVGVLRKYKHDEGLALNAPLGDITIYTPSHNVDDAGDLGRTVNAQVAWKAEEPKLEKTVGDVVFNKGVVGKTLRGKAGAFMAAVNALSDTEKITPPAVVIVDGEETAVPENAWTTSYVYSVSGMAVDVIMVDDAIITIRKA